MKTIEELKNYATEARRITLLSIYKARSGHPGGSLSAIEILAELFFNRLGITPENAADIYRNRFVLSKGHAAPALYAMAFLAGLAEYNHVVNLRKIGSKAQGHPDLTTWPWLDASTGSLGQGFSMALGMALSYQRQSKEFYVYAMLGDGELQEGQVWESAMAAAHHKVSNLIAIVDYNKLQSDDLNSNIMGLEPLGEKFKAFGWHVLEIDGHNLDQIKSALDEAESEETKPSMIIANTIKGKGVDFMENVPAWHGSVTMSESDTLKSLVQLDLDNDEASALINKEYRLI